MNARVRTLAAAVIASGATAAAVVGAPSALASSHGCGDNVCVTFDGGKGSDVSVTAWAYATTVYGHFELTGPYDYSDESVTKSWAGGQVSDAWETTIPTARPGTYCVTLYGANDENFGTACEGVS